MNIPEELKNKSFHQIVKSRVPSLQRDGREFSACCPFHKEDTPSFKLYQHDDGIWLFKCFGCGASGNVFQFVEKFDKIQFSEAVEKVKDEFNWEEGKEVVEAVFTEVIPTNQSFVTFPISKIKVCEEALENSPQAQKWLEDRGIGMDIARAMHLGFVQNLKVISPNHPWVADGWIAFPTIQNDVVTAIKYRSLRGKKTDDGKKSGILRAQNTSTTLYNLESVTPIDDVFITEGEPDTVVMMQAGFTAVGLPSAEYVLTPAEKDVITRARRIFLAGDNDTVGQAAMKKLWGELKDRTYLIEWPSGQKDANDVFVRICDKNVQTFEDLVEALRDKALERPIPDFYDVRQTLQNADDTPPMDNPSRLHFRDKRIDEMAIVLPGNVVSIFATYTGSGKTTWCLDQFELEEAMNHGRVVLNYSAELSPDEFARLVASNILEKDRLSLTREDFQKSSKILEERNSKFYVGYNPDLNRIGLVLESIEWAIRRLGAHIVILDHLHFLARGEKSGDEYKIQADAMQRIKNLAVKYQVIFVVVGQSRKEQPGRKGRPSETSDAKGSETFVSDASATYHIHRGLKKDIDWDRPETWPSDLLDTTTDVRLYKCRTKGPGKAVARQIFKGQFSRFYPMTSQERVG